MKVEILYSPDCPCYPITLQLVYAASEETGIEANVETIRVESEADARRLRFLGSPTVRVDGVDVQAEVVFGRRDYGLRCRLHRHNSGAFAYPPPARSARPWKSPTWPNTSY